MQTDNAQKQATVLPSYDTYGPHQSTLQNIPKGTTVVTHILVVANSCQIEL